MRYLLEFTRALHLEGISLFIYRTEYLILISRHNFCIPKLLFIDSFEARLTRCPYDSHNTWTLKKKKKKKSLFQKKKKKRRETWKMILSVIVDTLLSLLSVT